MTLQRRRIPTTRPRVRKCFSKSGIRRTIRSLSILSRNPVSAEGCSIPHSIFTDILLSVRRRMRSRCFSKSACSILHWETILFQRQPHVMKPSWIEIHEDAVRHNYLCLREQLGKGPKLMAVVKANAYGHDLRKFGKLVQSLGVDWMGVSTLDEALSLRSGGVTTPILLLTGSHDAEEICEAAKQGISITIANRQGLETLRTIPSDVAGILRIHLKFDTGMHR